MLAAVRLFRASLLFGRIFASYLVQLALVRLFGAARMRARWRRVHRRNARRMYRGFVRLRGVFIKLGQILSIMGNFLPRAYTDELEGLQDEVPPRPFRSIARAIERSLGRPLPELFAALSASPLAAASLGQVHDATTHDGERVAVKVLYPDVEMVIKVDLRVLGWVLRVYERFVPIRQIVRVHEQLTDMLSRETNYRHEAACLERMTANFADDPDVLFPRVRHDLSTERVLTMSFMDGVKIGRVTAIEALGLDPVAVATKLIKVFYKQLFLDRFFHADPHPGNFFVQRGDAGQVRLVVLDFGAASEITDDLAEGMLDVLSGMIGRDDDRTLRGLDRMGFAAPDGDRALLERVARTYFEKLLALNITNFGKISPDVAQKLMDFGVRRAELREVMKSIEYPIGWFFVERAVVIMFGLAARLAPTLNTFQVGFPYVMQFLTASRDRASASSGSPADLRRTSRDSRPGHETPSS